MGTKTNSQAGKSTKAAAQKKKAEEDLFVEVFNEPEKVDETTSESYCPFDLLGDGEIKEAIYGSYSETELEELNAKGEEELGPVPESIIGVDERKRINSPFKFPNTAICSLRITAKDGGRYIGTGFFVGPRVVLTAGHCVYMHDNGGWAKSIEVIPALDGSTQSYGSAVTSLYYSLVGWTKNKNTEYDYAAIILPENAALGKKTGWFGYCYHTDDNYFKNLEVTLAGYPGDKGGSQQWGMSGKTSGVTNNGRKFAYKIDTYGGQSGSPVYVVNNNSYYAKGIHTNGGSSYNYATRINKNIFELVKGYKEKYPAK